MASKVKEEELSPTSPAVSPKSTESCRNRSRSRRSSSSNSDARESKDRGDSAPSPTMKPVPVRETEDPIPKHVSPVFSAEDDEEEIAERPTVKENIAETTMLTGDAATGGTGATQRPAVTEGQSTSSLPSPRLRSATRSATVYGLDARGEVQARAVASDGSLQSGLASDAERLRRLRQKKNLREAKRKAKKRAAKAAARAGQDHAS